MPGSHQRRGQLVLFIKAAVIFAAGVWMGQVIGLGWSIVSFPQLREIGSMTGFFKPDSQGEPQGALFSGVTSALDGSWCERAARQLCPYLTTGTSPAHQCGAAAVSLVEFYARVRRGACLASLCECVVWTGFEERGHAAHNANSAERMESPVFFTRYRGNWVMNTEFHTGEIPTANRSELHLEFLVQRLALVAQDGIVLNRQSEAVYAMFELYQFSRIIEFNDTDVVLLRKKGDRARQYFRTHLLGEGTTWLTYTSPPVLSSRDYSCVALFPETPTYQEKARARDFYDQSLSLKHPDTLLRKVILADGWKNTDYDSRTISIESSEFWDGYELMFRAVLHYFTNVNSCAWIYFVSSSSRVNPWWWRNSNLRPRLWKREPLAFGAPPYFVGLNRAAADYLIATSDFSSSGKALLPLVSTKMNFTSLQDLVIGRKHQCVNRTEFEKLDKLNCFLFTMDWPIKYQAECVPMSTFLKRALEDGKQCSPPLQHLALKISNVVQR